MAEVIQNEGGKQKGKKRAKRHSTHIDMTPMVDLFCLLLTFFMLTTSMSKPKVMEIVLPEKPKINDPNPPKVDSAKALNIILIGDNKVLWYNGMPDLQKTVVHETNFSDDGIRRILLKRNKDLFEKVDQLNQDVLTGRIKMPRDTVDSRVKDLKTADKVGPVVLIKASEDVKYKNVVDIIDEMTITNIARYALVDINDVEKKMVANYMASHSNAASQK
jgi:biopolymer transport protein ExbD